MSIGTTLLNRVRGTRDTALSIIHDIARRESEGLDQREDVDRLAQALRASEKCVDYYDEIVGIFRRAKELRSAASGVEKLVKAHEAADRKAKAYDAETETILKERTGELRNLVCQTASIDHQLKHARKRLGEFHQLMCDHPALFEKEHHVDMDRVTPVCGENLPCAYDPAVPHYDLPYEAWKKENDRRHRIMENARSRAQRDHEGAMADWRRRAKDNLLGQIIHDSPSPDFQLLRWRDVVERGLNKMID